MTQRSHATRVLYRTNLSGARLNTSSFVSADLTEADLTDTTLVGVSWYDARCPDGQKGPYPCRNR